MTLSFAYLSVLTHQRNRERQAAILRQQTLALTTALHDPLPPKLPPITRAERAAEERRGLVEAAKTRWNAEVEAAVRWAQNEDWEASRERLESVVGSAWARAFGSAVDEAAKAEGEIQQSAARARDNARGTVKDAAERGKQAISNLGQATSGADDAADKAAEKLRGDGSATSPEEKALQQRYKQSRPDDRSAEEVLAERYAAGGKRL